MGDFRQDLFNNMSCEAGNVPSAISRTATYRFNESKRQEVIDLILKVQNWESYYFEYQALWTIWQATGRFERNMNDRLVRFLQNTGFNIDGFPGNDFAQVSGINTPFTDRNDGSVDTTDYPQLFNKLMNESWTGNFTRCISQDRDIFDPAPTRLSEADIEAARQRGEDVPTLAEELERIGVIDTAQRVTKEEEFKIQLEQNFVILFNNLNDLINKSRRLISEITGGAFRDKLIPNQSPTQAGGLETRDFETLKKANLSGLISIRIPTAVQHIKGQFLVAEREQINLPNQRNIFEDLQNVVHGVIITAASRLDDNAALKDIVRLIII